MPKFAIAPEADQARLTTVKTPDAAINLAPYVEAISKLLTPENAAQPGYTKWARIELGDGEVKRTERRRFTTAAKSLSKTLGYADDENKESPVFWVRVRPEPTPRAKRTPKVATDGPVVIEAPAANGKATSKVAVTA